MTMIMRVDLGGIDIQHGLFYTYLLKFECIGIINYYYYEF